MKNTCKDAVGFKLFLTFHFKNSPYLGQRSPLTINKALTMRQILTILFLGMIGFLHGQVDLGYQQPVKEILDLVDAPMPPTVRINSEGTHALLLYRRAHKTIAELSQPELRLAGLRINPKSNIGSRTRFYYKMTILDIANKKEQVIEGLPKEAQLAYFSWSPNEQYVAYTLTRNNTVELWLLDVAKHQTKKISTESLNANMGTPMVWMKDNQSLLVKTLPSDVAPLIDKKETVPTGPTISENAGKKAQNRTYQDLLKDKVDEQNFERLAQSVIQKININGDVAEWMPLDLYRSMSVSPDGKNVMVTKIEKPFSYLVPYYRFPFNTSVYSTSGKLVKTMLQVPLVEDLPKGFMAVREGKRNLRWRADKPATIYWTEALDGGDPAAKATYRDAVYEQAVPFDGSVNELIKTHNRFSYMQWGNDGLAIAHDRWFNNRNTKSYIFNPSNADAEVKMISDRNYQDRYSDPGYFVTQKNKYDQRVLSTANNKLYLIGDGYSDDGILPFVDEYDLGSGAKKRIYRAPKNDQYEVIYSAIDVEKGIYLTRLESKSEFPNFYFRNIKQKGNLESITQFENPFKSIQNVHKEVINYKRADGLDLSGTLYLPAGYDKNSGEKLPMLLWAYPREYKDKSSAGQVTSSPNSFTYPYYGSALFWVTRGFAVLDRAAFPIVGEEEEEPNDSFREQLVANGKAAIDAVDELGYIDRNRVGVGGHSYGAFMVANLLSHSDLFAGGIARSGAYNRTLTPFGFQREERSYWDAPEVYYNMSPFMHADKMKTPLLLIHGEADNNSGTYPMQSERYFNALKGLGATVRLVMLPKESHGYAARESILHMLWEQDQWLEKHVKNREMGKEVKEVKP